MEYRLPEVEFFIVMKWMIVIMVGASLATLAGLIVKRWWYGNPKFNRRGEDNDATRGWLDRYIALQKETNSVNVTVINKLDEVVNALKDNGTAIKEAGEAFKCNYEHRGR